MDYYSSSSSSEDSTSSVSYEIVNAITSVVQLMVEFMQHVSQPLRSILRRKQIERDHEAANALLMRDYFCDQPVYGPREFRRRFRMSKRLFLRITNNLERKYYHFK
ncbi:hypothetical protein HanRHA438_Chr02g0055951 [Helianthus annuus]|nr:hypothetical protein HanRHA438_Chr02g0055951 [Helianthus annuus]